MAEYFIIFGVLITLYCVLRTALFPIFQEYRLYRSRPPSEPYTGTVNAIDTSKLSDRLEQVWQNRQAQPHGSQPSFKQSLLVESRREELSRHGYFQKPSPHAAHEDEHGLTMQGV